MDLKKLKPTWIPSKLIAEKIGEQEIFVRNAEALMRADSTIPFIAR